MFRRIYKKQNHKKGYTLIETLVSISLFLVIVFSGMSALLNINFIHQKSSNMRSILDNLSFIMEDVSRNLRTGYNYRCYPTGTWNESTDPGSAALNTSQSCISGGVLVFEETDGVANNPSDQWVYKFESVDSGVTFGIYKSTDGGVNFVKLNTDEINLSSVSGFSVLGAESYPSDLQQPLVNIRLSGEIDYKGEVTPFDIETTVSQRLVDI